MHAAEAIYQPSSGDRTLNCPGWWQLSKELPSMPISEHALRGTLAHEIASICLKRNINADSYIGKTAFMNEQEDITFAAIPEYKWYCKITEGMSLAIQVYLDEVRAVREALPLGEFFVEEYTKMDWLVKGLGGTADHIAIDPGQTIYCHDYKHGAGHFVDVGKKVGDNVQTSLYALGAVGSDNPHEVVNAIATIVQPRHYIQPVIRSVEYPVKELVEWGYDVVVPAIKKAKAPGELLKKGDWCAFCPAQYYAVCPERNKALFDNLDDPVLKPVLNAGKDPAVLAKLTGAQLDYILEKTSEIKEQLAVIHGEAYRRLEHNDPDRPLNYKLVEGAHAKRRWMVNNEEVIKKLALTVSSDALVEQRIKSPAVVEKILLRIMDKSRVKKIITPLVNAEERNKPIMVSVKDSRPELANTMFGSLDEEFDPMAE